MKSKIPTTTIVSPVWFILPIILAISGIAAIRYQSRLISPPASPITTLNQKTKAISQTTSFFYTQVFLDRDQTFVSIPFRFPKEASNQPLWLLLLLEDNDHLLRLIHHPQLAGLTWSSIESNGVRLFQRQKNYASFDQFLQNPPAKNAILLDESLKDQTWFANLSGTLFNSQNSDINLDQFNYILTYYQPPRTENDWYIFETILDASNAQVNIKEELVWEINAPKATLDSPYLLGTIHVDYRQ